MEKTDAAAMLPLDVGWNDVGSWSSLWDIAPRDDNGNFIRGEAVLEDTTDCYVHSERVARLDDRRQRPRHRRYARCAARRRQEPHAGGLEDRPTPEAIEPQGAGAAPQKLSALGLFRDAQHRAALPGQAFARQARRQTFNANAPPSLGALDRRARHGPGRDRRKRAARA